MKKGKYKILSIIQTCIIVVLLVALIDIGFKDNEVTVDYLESIDTHILADETSFFCIGNSITVHGHADYWWTQCGMAASELKNDYVHKLAEKYSKDDNVKFGATNFYAWEVNVHDRAEALTLLDEYMTYEYDFIVIQLGENLPSNYDTLENDYVELVEYIQERQPKAEIIMVGQFWENDIVDEIKINACNRTGSIFVDLSEIQAVEKYMAGMGGRVVGDDGLEHVIEHSGVAAHPGDKGMEYIAQKIYAALNN